MGEVRLFEGICAIDESRGNGEERISDYFCAQKQGKMRFSIKILGALAVMLTFLAFPSCSKKRGEVKPISYNGSYNRDFNDLNDLHLAMAQKIGIKPIKNREEAGHASKKMKEIKTCEYYEVEELKHSIPYLIPEAAELLEDIGRSFQDSLQNLNAPRYRIKVTSVTRTVDDVQNLRRRNTNASKNSAHRYGTTFDISWVRFSKMENDELDIDKDQLKMVLASVLRDMRRAERCYIKHERRQGCFHITVRK